MGNTLNDTITYSQSFIKERLDTLTEGLEKYGEIIATSLDAEEVEIAALMLNNIYQESEILNAIAKNLESRVSR